MKISSISLPSGDHEFPSPNIMQTKKDKQMKAALDLKLFGDRLKDLKIEMEEISKILSDPKSSLRDRKSCTNIIKNTILPFLDQASDVCKQSSKVLAPIPSLAYVHRTNEAKNKEKLRELQQKCDKKKAKRNSLRQIEQSIDLRRPLTKINPNISRITTRPKLLHKNKLPTEVSNIKAPSNGIQYTPLETIDLLSHYPDNSKVRSHLIDHLVAMKLIPISRSSVYDLLKKAEKERSFEINGGREVAKNS